MKITRIYTGEDGQSHFDDVEYPFQQLDNKSYISDFIEATGAMFRKADPAGREDRWHNAPRRQIVALLSGAPMEIVTGDGSTRRLNQGDLFLAEDTTGQGHISKCLGSEPRVTLSVTLD